MMLSDAPVSIDGALLPCDWHQRPLSELARLAPLERVDWRLADRYGVTVWVKREDLLHPQLGGNKFYKLHAHLQRMSEQSARTLLTFGGAYSNHIHAVASAAQLLGFRAVAIVRGERPPQLSPTLSDAMAGGMELIFVSRQQYRDKYGHAFLSSLRQQLGSFYLIPEGGGDATGSLGCTLWGETTIAMMAKRPTAICVALGTGGTAAGLLAGDHEVPVHAYSSLKGRPAEFSGMSDTIASRAREMRKKKSEKFLFPPSLHLHTDYHCGGYAKFPPYLRSFVEVFTQETRIPLDPVYTAKVFWGLSQQMEQGYWPRDSHLLVLHTGGLQGNRGFSLDEGVTSKR